MKSSIRQRRVVSPYRVSNFENEPEWAHTVKHSRVAIPARKAVIISWAGSSGASQVRIVDEAVVGSSDDADITLKTPTVSRVHCRIELSPEGAWVSDLDSLNGTFVGDVRVHRALIPNGRTLRVGEVELTCRYEAKAQPLELHPNGRMGGLIGESMPMRALFAWIKKAASFDSPVLVQGETGTGKELVAACLHQESARSDKPYVIVDCGALPPTLIDSELFGHTKGAFTGASQAQDGLVMVADGGTLVLDEVGELPLELQPRLLRLLESKTIRPVGGRSYRKVDVRVVALTHRDLLQAVADGTFREDLYFRLAGLPLKVPPLRERFDDLPVLVRHFVESHDEGSERVSEITEAVIAHASRWQGNVRELRQFVERALAFGANAASQLQPPTSPSRGSFEVDPAMPFKMLRQMHTDQLELAYLKAHLSITGRSLSKIAERSGLDRSHVYRLLRKHGL